MGSGGPLAGFLQIEVTLPLEITPRSSLRVEFKPEDFPLSWLQFFQKHHEPLYDFLKEKRTNYIVRNHRVGVGKREWKLKDLIKDYINSFRRVLMCYKATVDKPKRPRRKHPPQQKRKSTRGSTRAAASPPPIYIIDISSSTEEEEDDDGGDDDAGSANDFGMVLSPPISLRGSGLADADDNGTNGISVSPSTEQEPNMPCSISSPTLILFADESGRVTLELDNASRAPTTVDIQLPEAPDGTDMMEIKRKIIRNIDNLDNASMLKVRHELQACVDNGKWLQLIRDLPMTAAALQLVLGVTSTSGE